jgi:hypothetical protein
MKNKPTIPSIELLNSEGPILKAYKIRKGYAIIDEHKEPIEILNREQMIDFIYDRMSLTDSKGRVFLYGKFPGSMKPDLRKLAEFVGLNTEGMSF